MSVTPFELERSNTKPPVTQVESLEDFIEMDITEEFTNKLDVANKQLKQAAVLFEFLSDPDMCKNITKRERGIINKQLDKIYAITEDLDSFLGDLT